ncbi:MAG: DUF429 domain-containing protein [Hyphomicrobiales bacterium]|nr:MAG: DUF429 domain-containing protein [Hyphomicrobiales bacterium]
MPAEDREDSGWVAGVDGCPAGWIAAYRSLDDEPPRLRLHESFAEILAAPENPRVVAVDMPIGLPDHIGPNGRGPEKAVRPLLGERQSSVFSIPARAAVMADNFGEACRLALETSDPPRKVSRQGFALFPKIREIDALMTPDLEARVFEVHPELAFWRLNGEQPMSLPKKVKSRPNPAGLDQRRELLVRFGYEMGFLGQKPPCGAGPDDLIDACVNAVIAERILSQKAEPFPPEPARDARGLRVAIWA